MTLNDDDDSHLNIYISNECKEEKTICDQTAMFNLGNGKEILGVVPMHAELDDDEENRMELQADRGTESEPYIKTKDQKWSREAKKQAQRRREEEEKKREYTIVLSPMAYTDTKTRAHTQTTGQHQYHNHACVLKTVSRNIGSTKDPEECEEARGEERALARERRSMRTRDEVEREREGHR